MDRLVHDHRAVEKRDAAWLHRSIDLCCVCHGAKATDLATQDSPKLDDAESDGGAVLFEPLFVPKSSFFSRI